MTEFTIPNCVIMDDNLSWIQKGILAYLKMISNNSGVAATFRKDVADYLGIDYETVMVNIELLKEYKKLQILEHGKPNVPSRYRIL